MANLAKAIDDPLGKHALSANAVDACLPPAGKHAFLGGTSPVPATKGRKSMLSEEQRQAAAAKKQDAAREKLERQHKEAQEFRMRRLRNDLVMVCISILIGCFTFPYIFDHLFR